MLVRWFVGSLVRVLDQPLKINYLVRAFTSVSSKKLKRLITLHTIAYIFF
jgi:hypothetical protein